MPAAGESAARRVAAAAGQAADCRPWLRRSDTFLNVFPRMRALALIAMRLLMVWVVAGTRAAGATAAGAANPAYPVPYDFLPLPCSAGLRSTPIPPGANVWSCKPSAAHPEPVVLVHGTGGNKNDNWQTYAPLLANNGYCVYALTYGVLPARGLPLSQVGGLGPIEKSAAQLGAFVDRCSPRPARRKVDIVGHSQGTLMPDYYAKFLGGGAKIDKYVSLAPLWHGTEPGRLGDAGRGSARPTASPSPIRNFGAGTEMLAGSAFMRQDARRRAAAVPGSPTRTSSRSTTSWSMPVHQRHRARDDEHRACRSSARSTSAITSRSPPTRSPPSTSSTPSTRRTRAGPLPLGPALHRRVNRPSNEGQLERFGHTRRCAARRSSRRPGGHPRQCGDA